MQKDKPNLTKVSICIPSSGRWHHLYRLLESIQRQDTSTCVYEVIIVTDMDKFEFIGDKLKLFRFNWRLFENSQNKVYAARNLGIREARGSIVYFVDEDCLFESRTHLKEFCKIHEIEKDVCVIGGRYESMEPMGQCAQAYNLVADLWIDKGVLEKERGGDGHLLAGNISFKLNEQTEKVKFSEERPFGGEEDLFLDYCRKQNISFKLNDNLPVIHFCDHNLKMLLNRAWLHGTVRQKINFKISLFEKVKLILNKKSSYSVKMLSFIYIINVNLSCLYKRFLNIMEPTPKFLGESQT